jgi:uncharacterized protein (DUF1330 family)
MSVYVIAQIDIHDRQEYQHYVAGFRALFGGYRGEVLVVEESPVVLEGQWDYTRTAVIRFENEQEMRRWYESPEYQAAAKFRFRSSTTHLAMVRGLK